MPCSALTRVLTSAVAVVTLGLVILTGQAFGAVGYAPLTQDERSAAHRIFNRDRDARTLLKGHNYIVTATVPWYTVERHETIGAVLTVTLANVSAITGWWKLMNYDRSETSTPPYWTNVALLGVTNLRSINVFVDIREGSVAGVMPDHTATITSGIEALGPTQATPLPENQFGTAPPSSAASSGGGALSADTVPPDSGSGGPGVGPVYVNGNRQFYNWDFGRQSTLADYADWPVTIIFGSNANIEKVKNGPLGGKYDNGGLCADDMWNRVGPTFAEMVWDDDSGKKDTCCPYTGGTTHFRVYGDKNDSPERLGYAEGWGYYVPATTHRDVQECPLGNSGARFGWSEDAEDELTNDSASIAGWHVVRNWVFLNNAERPAWVGNRYYHNDGYANRVFVP